MFENRPGKPFLLVGLKSDLRSDASNNDEKEEKFVTQAQVSSLFDVLLNFHDAFDFTFIHNKQSMKSFSTKIIMVSCTWVPKSSTCTIS